MLYPVQYLTNADQQIQSVVIGIEDWKKIQAQLLAFEQHTHFYENLRIAFSEVKAFQTGKKKARKLKDVLKEL